MKPVWASKINWMMMGLAAISILQVIQEWHARGDLSLDGCIGLAISIIVVLLRTFGNSTPIAAPKPFAPNEQSGKVL